MHQSKAVDATALPAKSLLSTIPLSPSSALPSPSTSEASGSTVNKPWNSMETQGNSMEIHIDGRKDIRHKARYPRESCSNRSLHVSILNRWKVSHSWQRLDPLQMPTEWTMPEGNASSISSNTWTILSNAWGVCPNCGAHSLASSFQQCNCAITSLVRCLSGLARMH